MAMKPALDVAALLASAASGKKASKSKSKTPEVTLKDIDPNIAAWLKAKQEKANAEAAMKQAEEVILPAALKARKDACRATGAFESSVVINDAVLVSTQNKYSPIAPDQKEALDKAFGDDVDKMFTLTTEISLTDRAVADPDALKKIIEAVGIDKFKDFLDVKQVLKPTESLHHGIVMDEKVDKKAQGLIDAGILKPYKASVKAK